MTKVRIGVLALFTALAVQAGTNALPFVGTVVAVDAKAGTLTLNGPAKRVLHVVPGASKLDRAGIPIATLAGVDVGETVKGSYNRSEPGYLTIIRASFALEVRK